MRTFDLNDEAKCLMYIEQTGRFPKKSSCRNQYIMVLIEIDSNAILVEAIKNQKSRQDDKSIPSTRESTKKHRSYTENAHLGQ